MQDTSCSHKKSVAGEVVWKKQAAGGHFQMELFCPHIARNATPGQFVLVRVSRLYDPLLCRPLAVYRTRGDAFEILFKVAGKGTRLLAEKGAGDVLDIIGPLGTSFPIDKDVQLPMLVAGGMGIASLVAVAEAMAGAKTIALIGASTRDKIVGEKDLQEMGADVQVATEDGTAGYKGTVSELLEDVLLKAGTSEVARCIFACGPTPMLKAIAQVAAQHEVPAYVSLEERMACGVGACLGCACEVVSPEGEVQYKMVCTDGPVFNAQEIVWK